MRDCQLWLRAFCLPPDLGYELELVHLWLRCSAKALDDVKAPYYVGKTSGKPLHTNTYYVLTPASTHPSVLASGSPGEEITLIILYAEAMGFYRAGLSAIITQKEYTLEPVLSIRCSSLILITNLTLQR